MSQQEKASTEIISGRAHSAPNHPFSLRRYHAFNLQRPIFASRGRCNRKLLSAKVQRTPTLLACFMFDGQGLRPANDSPAPCHVEMSKCKTNDSHCQSSAPNSIKGVPSRCQSRAINPRDALVFRNDAHDEAGDNAAPNDSVHV